MRFAAVSLDPDDGRIYSLAIYSNRFGTTPRFHCVFCRRMISDKCGTVTHVGPDGPTKPCTGNQFEEALQSVRHWAAFRANEEAKEDGRATGTFSLEDCQRWMKLAGCEPEHLSETEWSRLLRFVQELEALPADWFEMFKKRVTAGEEQIRAMNEQLSERKSPKKKKRKTPKTVVIDNDTELLPEKMATPDSSAYEHSVSACSYIFGNSKLPLTKLKIN
jgi:hypothetical protein